MKSTTAIPLVYDSMGVRSMCTFVNKGNLNLLIDPGAALGPSRYGLPPTKLEIAALEFYRSKIINFLQEANTVFISHYHYDHHPFPDDNVLYSALEGKTILLKDPENDVNLSGRKRGKYFFNRIKETAREVIIADGKSVEINGVNLEVSPAVWHGDVGSRVGKVIMLSIDGVVFGSDAQCLADPDARKWVTSKRPDLLIVDGYPTIFLGWKLSWEKFRQARDEFRKLLDSISPKKVIFDHHGVRDLKFRERMENFWGNQNVLTAAEYLGLPNLFLEARRKELTKHSLINLHDFFEKWENATKIS